MNSIFKAFISAFPPSEDLIAPELSEIAKYKGILPETLLDFWLNFGFGNYANGLIKVINPDEYRNSLYEWLGHKDKWKLPILTTAFGDMFYYRKLSDSGDEDICFLDIHHRKIDVCVWSLTDFFESYITDKKIIKELLNEDLFNEALSKKDKLKFDEIYYFVPALIVGGKPDIANIDKGNGIAHQSLLFEMSAQ